MKLVQKGGSEEFYLNCFEFLADKIPFVQQVDYNRLMNVTGVLPDSYFDRFCNIRSVYVGSKVKSHDHLASFFAEGQEFE